MRVKRFVGESITDTMNKVKRDLGADAVIIQTRKIKEGGFLGFFAKTKVEITAVLEEKNKTLKKESHRENKPLVSAGLVKRAYETVQGTKKRSGTRNSRARNSRTRNKCPDGTETDAYHAAGDQGPYCEE